MENHIEPPWTMEDLNRMLDKVRISYTGIGEKAFPLPQSKAQDIFDLRLLEAGWDVNAFPHEPVFELQVWDKPDSKHPDHLVAELSFTQVSRDSVDQLAKATDRAGLVHLPIRPIIESVDQCCCGISIGATKQRLRAVGLTEREIAHTIFGTDTHLYIEKTYQAFFREFEILLKLDENVTLLLLSCLENHILDTQSVMKELYI